MTYMDAAGVAYPAEARLFADDLNEIEAIGEETSVVSGCFVGAGTNSGTIKLNVGYAVFDGLLKAVPGSGALYVATDNIAFIAAAGVVDSTNPRFVLIELTPSLTINLNIGSASATPEVPNRTAGNIVLSKAYVPANAGAVESSVTSTSDGDAKLHDMRRLKRLNVSKWTPDLSGYTMSTPTTNASATLQPWTRASNTQFTISSATDYSGRFAPGTKLRWSESGVVKYGHVASASFASSTTTVNLIANNDYAMAATPDANSCFFCDSGTVPSDFPEWFHYSPTFTGFTTTPSGYMAKYRISGRQCMLFFDLPSNATNNGSSTNAFTITAPVAMATDGSGSMSCGVACSRASDNGTHCLGSAEIDPNASTTVINIYKFVVTISTYSGTQNLLVTGLQAWQTTGAKSATFTLPYPI